MASFLKGMTKAFNSTTEIPALDKIVEDLLKAADRDLKAGTDSFEDISARYNALYDERAHHAINRKVVADDDKDVFLVRKRMLNRGLRERSQKADAAHGPELARLIAEITDVFNSAVARLPMNPREIPSVFAAFDRTKILQGAEDFLEAKEDEIEELNVTRIQEETNRLNAEYKAAFDDLKAAYEANVAQLHERMVASVPAYMDAADGASHFEELFTSFNALTM